MVVVVVVVVVVPSLLVPALKFGVYCLNTADEGETNDGEMEEGEENCNVRPSSSSALN